MNYEGLNDRGQRAYGSGDMSTLFGDAPTTSTPWRQAPRSKKAPLYDKSLVNQALSNPETFNNLSEIDPRTLWSTQPSIVRSGVQHYMDQAPGSAASFADTSNVGNRHPVVYTNSRGHNILLSGHHRATVSLLNGQPLQAVHIQEQRPVTAAKSYTCKFCKEPATKGVLWAEGMGIVPACDKHEQKAKDSIDDPSDISGVKDLTKKSSARPWFVRVAKPSAKPFSGPDNKPLPYGPNTFYRIHPGTRRFSPWKADSTDLEGGAGRFPGYSSFNNPHDLYRYLRGMAWDTGVGPEDSKHGFDLHNPHKWLVTQYQGDHVAHGMDEEPLSMPHSRERVTMPYSTFLNRLNVTPHPDTNRHWHYPEVDEDGSEVGGEKGWHEGNGQGCIPGQPCSNYANFDSLEDGLPYQPTWDPEDDGDIEFPSNHRWGATMRPFFVRQGGSASGEESGLKDRWSAGESAHYEYHCLESPESCDAPLWYRSHQPVQILGPNENDDAWKYMGDLSLAERAGEGSPGTYRVRFPDGHEGDAWEDELFTDPKHWYKPDPPKMPKESSVEVRDLKKTSAIWDPNGPDKLTFRHEPPQENMYGDGFTPHLIEARVNGKYAGYMELHHDLDSPETTASNLSHGIGFVPGEIRNVEIEKPFRGRGIARAIGQYAQSLGVNPVHSNRRTPEGNGFANATPEFGNTPLERPVPSYYAKKATRYVRTDEGADYYGKPIGSPIGDSQGEESPSKDDSHLKGLSPNVAKVVSSAPDESQVEDLRSSNANSAYQYLQSVGDHWEFTPERQKMHEKIIAGKLAEYHGKKSDKPTYMVLGGGPAAGKSSVMSLSVDQENPPLTVNPDDMKAEIPEYNEEVQKGNRNASGIAHEESSYLAKKLQASAQAAGYDIMLDGTGDGSVASMRKKISDARAAGCKVVGAYVTAPTDACVSRALSRGERTGRFVSERVLRSTHIKVSQILPQIIEDFDELNLYDNEVPKGVAPIHVLSYTREGGVRVLDQDRYQKFLDKGKESPDPKEGHNGREGRYQLRSDLQRHSSRRQARELPIRPRRTGSQGLESNQARVGRLREEEQRKGLGYGQRNPVASLEVEGAIDLSRNQPMVVPGHDFNPDSYYRQIGEAGYNDFLSSGIVRPAQGTKQQYSRAYYSQGAPLGRYRLEDIPNYFVETASHPSIRNLPGIYPHTLEGEHLTSKDPMRIYRWHPDEGLSIVHDTTIPLAQKAASKVYEMPYEKFIKTFQPGSGGSWNDAFSEPGFHDGGDEGHSTSSLVNSMKQNGFTHPVDVDVETVMDGLHRVNAAGRAGVPVRYTRTEQSRFAKTWDSSKLPLDFEYIEPEDDYGQHTIRAFHADTGEDVGHIDLDSGNGPVPRGLINMIKVNPQYRGKGVARALGEYAQNNVGIEPIHSDILTGHGKAFKAKTPQWGSVFYDPDGKMQVTPGIKPPKKDPAKQMSLFGANSLQFQHVQDNLHDNIYAVRNGEPVGMLQLHRAHEGTPKELSHLQNGEIRFVGVPPELRGQGIAKSMAEYAQSAGFNPLHSPAQTEDGKGWASKIDLPYATRP